MPASDLASTTVLTVIAALGLVFSLLSAAERRITLVARFCAFFGAGCRRTADFTFLGVPIAWWGTVFYVVLLGAVYTFRPVVFWLVMLGAGFELTFLWILLRIRAFCIFCLLNALVVIGLFISVYDAGDLRLGVPLLLVVFVVSAVLIKYENPENMTPGEIETETEPEPGGAPSWGPRDAKVEVVVYSDYLCPACRKAHATVRKVRDAYKDRVRWTFVDLPLPIHEGAWELAEAAHCAGEQGRFGQFQDLAFRADDNPNRDEMVSMAADLGLDVERFEECLDSRRHRSTVQGGVDKAGELGIDATPTFVINGRVETGAMSEANFRRLIEEALESSG